MNLPHESNSYVPAMLSIFYTVPELQAAIFKDAEQILASKTTFSSRLDCLKTSSTVSTALIFASMRIHDIPMDLGAVYFEALNKELARDISGKFIIFGNFFAKYQDHLSSNIKSRFRIQTEISIFRADTKSFLKSFQTTSSIIGLPLSGRGDSISQYILRQFLDESKLFTGPPGSRFETVPLVKAVRILDTPPVLMFDLKRVEIDTSAENRGTIKFNSEIVRVDKQIIVNGATYTLVGTLGFNPTTKAYFSNGRDFGNNIFYRMEISQYIATYDDTSMSTDFFEDNNSVLLVYAQMIKWSEFSLTWYNQHRDIPDSIKLFLQEISGILADGRNCNVSLKRKREESEIVNSSEFVVATENVITAVPSTNISENITNNFSTNITDNISTNTSSNISENISDNAAANPSTNIIDNSLASGHLVTSIFSAPRENSYLVALFSFFYAIPEIQNAFFNEAAAILSAATDKTECAKSSIVVALAIAFAQMKLHPGIVVDLGTSIFDVLEKQFKYNFRGKFVRFNTFLYQISQILTKGITNLYELDLDVSYYRAEDDMFMKRIQRRFGAVPVLLAQEAQSSIGWYVANDFVEKRKLSNIESPAGGTFLGYSSINILNIPKYLMIEINRVQIQPDRQLFIHSSPVWIEEEIKLREICYVLVARVEFDLVSESYFTIVRNPNSPSSLISYRNGNYSVVEGASLGNFFDNRSVLLLYERKWDRFQEVVRVPTIIQNAFYGSMQQQLYSQVQEASSSQVTRVPIPPKVLYKHILDKLYKPNFSEFPQNVVEQFLIPVEQRIIEKLPILSFDNLNFYSKFLYGTYQLGKESYSFQEPIFASLQFLLGMMASSVDFVTKLFQFTLNNPHNNVELQLAIVIVKMLLGLKNISLQNLITEIAKKSKFEIDFFFYNGSTYYLGGQIKKIINQIDPSLIANPQVKKIAYKDLESDEPVTITNFDAFPVDSENVIPSTSADIRGVWLDTVSTYSKKVRNRLIFKSTALIFPIEISRVSRRGKSFTTDTKKVETKSMDFTVNGCITLSETDGNLVAYYVNRFNDTYTKLIPGEESETIESSPSALKMIRSAMFTRSVQLFLNSKEDENGIVFSSAIPQSLFNAAFNQMILSENK